MERLTHQWPVFAEELRAALIAEGEEELAASVGDLEVAERCDCGDDLCQSFFTGPAPDGPWGPGLRNLWLEPPWPEMLIVDVVDDVIRYVEVLDRPARLN
ncbi:hypothetical protein [Isoptericola sp. NPDC057559]|uniref:hypothetical protein n=1 Tax=Isoptericola sp. NPDC057559 TaxID=3346168 RepID=UPI0036A31630